MATHKELYRNLDITILFTAEYTYTITIAGVRLGGKHQNQKAAIAAAHSEVDGIWGLVNAR